MIVEPRELGSMIIFGSPGTGKTHFIGTSVVDERLMPCLFLDLEGGTLCIKSKCVYCSDASDILSESSEVYSSSVATSKLVVYKPKSFAETSNIIRSLARKDFLRNFYKCVVVDSLSELNYLLLRETISERGKDPDSAPEIADYGRSGAKLRTFLKDLRDISQLSLATCLAKIETDTFGRNYTCSSLVGQLGVQVTGIVDAVAYMDIKLKDKEVVRTFTASQTPGLKAKDRTEGCTLSKVFENPTITEILNTANYAERQTTQLKPKTTNSNTAN